MPRTEFLYRAKSFDIKVEIAGTANGVSFAENNLRPFIRNLRDKDPYSDDKETNKREAVRDGV